MTPNRRHFLEASILSISTGLQFSMSSTMAKEAPTHSIRLLYKKHAKTDLDRLDPSCQVVITEIEGALLNAGYSVMQPSPDVHRVLDRGEGAIITFARTSGLSLIFAASKTLKRTTDTDVAELLSGIKLKLFFGAHLIHSAQLTGSLRINASSEMLQHSELEAVERIAKQQAGKLISQLHTRIKSITASDLTRWSLLGPESESVEAPPTPPRPTAAPSHEGGTGHSGPATASLSDINHSGGQRHALVVSLSDYSSLRQSGARITDLPGVAIDHANITGMLLKLGFTKENTTAFSNAEATTGNVRTALANLLTRAGPDDLVFIYIAGHGAPANYVPSGYGMPVLADTNLRGDANALDYWELQSKVSNFRAGRVVVVIDTCHAGGASLNQDQVEIAADGFRSTQTGIPTVDARTFAGGFGQRHVAILCASSVQEVALEFPDKRRGGVFTYNLVSALAERPGQRSLGDLMKQVVFPSVVKQSSEMCKLPRSDCKQQTPRLAYAGRGYDIRL